MTEITWTSEIPLDRAEKIDPRAICAYLQGHGWVVWETHGPVRAKFYHRPGAAKDAVVVLDRDYADYLRRTQEVIVDIARAERRPIGDVLQEFSTCPVTEQLQADKAKLRGAVRIYSDLLDHGRQIEFTELMQICDVMGDLTPSMREEWSESLIPDVLTGYVPLPTKHEE